MTGLQRIHCVAQRDICVSSSLPRVTRIKQQCRLPVMFEGLFVLFSRLVVMGARGTYR